MTNNYLDKIITNDEKELTIKQKLFMQNFMICCMLGMTLLCYGIIAYGARNNKEIFHIIIGSMIFSFVAIVLPFIWHLFIKPKYIFDKTNRKVFRKKLCFKKEIMNFNDINAVYVSAGYIASAMHKSNKLCLSLYSNKTEVLLECVKPNETPNEYSITMEDMNYIAKLIAETTNCKYIEGKENIETDIYNVNGKVNINNELLPNEDGIIGALKSKKYRTLAILLCIYFGYNGYITYKQIMSSKTSSLYSTSVLVDKRLPYEILKEKKFKKEDLILPPSNPNMETFLYSSDWTNTEKYPWTIKSTKVCKTDDLNAYYALCEHQHQTFELFSSCFADLKSLYHINNGLPPIEGKTANQTMEKYLDIVGPAMTQTAYFADYYFKVNYDDYNKTTDKSRGVIAKTNEEIRKLMPWVLNEKYEEAYGTYTWAIIESVLTKMFSVPMKHILLFHPAVLKCDHKKIADKLLTETDIKQDSIKGHLACPKYWSSIKNKEVIEEIPFTSNRFSCVRDGIEFSVSALPITYSTASGSKNISVGHDEELLKTLLKSLSKKYNHNEITFQNIKIGNKDYFQGTFESEISENASNSINLCNWLQSHFLEAASQTVPITPEYIKQNNLKIYQQTVIYAMSTQHYFVSLFFTTNAFNKEESVARMKRNKPLFEELVNRFKFEEM